MKYEAIMFDLDGTLLPMDMEVFTKGYFQELTKKLSPIGLAPDAIIAAVWSGTKAMVKNDGTRTNEEVFWDNFAAVTGVDVEKFHAESDDFYVNEFENARVCVGENPMATEAIRLAHEKAKMVVLASNPLFPRTGQLKRASWVGLQESDFDYVTSYESESSAKPNPEYYKAICKKLGLNPENCLMVGNDVREDMQAGSAAGFNCYLVTDCIITAKDYEWKGPRGTFAELIEYLKA